MLLRLAGEYMRKVRVTREMPFAKVGEEFEIGAGYAIRIPTRMNYCEYYFKEDIEYLIKTSWLEYVEEKKTLKEKILDIKYRVCGDGYIELKEEDASYTSVVAKEHFMQILDDIEIKYCNHSSREDYISALEDFRKAIEEA